MKQIQKILTHFLVYNLLTLNPHIHAAKLTLNLAKDVIQQIETAGLWHNNSPLKLHLGCGENHMNGYLNIDYPASEHTVQVHSGADIFADLTKIKFPSQSVDEVRSHHVFEHFDRPTALALLCKWYDWLKVGGNIVIETPDFDASIKMLVTNQYPYKAKQSIMRHVFGSHEADWAIHCDGWYQEKFYHTLTALGFDNVTFEFTQWQLTRNIIVRAQKTSHKATATIQQRAHGLLRDSMVDNSSSEEKMWAIWRHNFAATMQ